MVAACNNAAPTTDPAPSRVDGAKTHARKPASLEAFCDLAAPAETAKPYVEPRLATPARSDDATAIHARWRWINLWATWCKPCVEEIPRLLAWSQRHPAIDIRFYSVDEAAADVDEYKAAHPDRVPRGELVRLAEPYDAWLARLGLTNGSTIPIHLFVDPAGRVRCIRAGGVRDEDLRVVEQLVGGA